MSKCITTYTGLHFYPLKPDINDIKIEDIAHALSLICRGNGQVSVFYSVGQHCIQAAMEAMARDYDKNVIMACLLHDASECYLSDIPGPIKSDLKDYSIYEDRILELVYQKYLDEKLSKEQEAKVKEIDKMLLAHDLFYLLKEGRREDTEHVLCEYSYDVIPFLQVEHKFMELFNQIAAL